MVEGLVLEIEVQDTQPVVAMSVIQYIEGLYHPSDVQKVEFILSVKNERLIRRIGEEAEQLDTSSWQFVTEPDDDDEKASDMVSDSKTNSLSGSVPPLRDEANYPTECAIVTNIEEQITLRVVYCTDSCTSPGRVDTLQNSRDGQTLTSSSNKNVPNDYTMVIE